MGFRHSLGRRAENAVADYLHASGFAILAQNLRLGALEIDLVARRGPLVAMVEVRARGAGAYERPFASIAGIKRTRLLYAAERLWRRRVAAMKDVERMRIDVAAVHFEGGRTFVEYVPGAISAM
jgi:putative endonuclease